MYVAKIIIICKNFDFGSNVANCEGQFFSHNQADFQRVLLNIVHENPYVLLRRKIPNI